uniref:Uncharacterized protein n=1 Tax=Arundo donax TaxID=35708 RepID=A0A0A9E2Q3_ARUDO
MLIMKTISPYGIPDTQQLIHHSFLVIQQLKQSTVKHPLPYSVCMTKQF